MSRSGKASNRHRSLRPCASTSPSLWPRPERGQHRAHHSGSPMRKAKPGGDQNRASAAAQQRAVDAGVQVRARRQVPSPRRETQPGSLGSRILSSTFTKSRRTRPAMFGDPIGEPSGDVALGHGPASVRSRRHQTKWIVLLSPAEGTRPGATSLARIQSQRCAGAFCRAFSTTLSSPPPKPMTSWPAVVAAPRDGGEDIWISRARRSTGGPPPVLLQLRPAGSRPASRRRPRHDRDIDGGAASQAASISEAVSPARA